MADLYIWIPKWDGTDDEPGFQHYSNRDPIWIKNYTRLLSKDEYLGLSAQTRGVLHGIWLAYAMSHRRLSGDTARLSARLGVRVFKRDLEALSHAGFIQLVASDVLADRYQDASPEVEVEEERPSLTQDVDLGVEEGEPEFDPADIPFDIPAVLVRSMPD